jgi:hypothetical protein
MARLLDFSDLVTAVRNELKIPDNDDHTIDKIKFDINIIYEQEVVPYKRWLWLTGHTKAVHKNFHSVGTASVTPNSTTVILSAAPNVTLGSFQNYYFSVDGFSEVYEINAHTAASTTVTLSSAYQGALNATAAYKIWSDRLALPTDCKEVVEVYHQRWRKNMEGRGFQDFRQIVNESPKESAFPMYFNVQEYHDPTPLTDMTESDRIRIMRVHPAVTTEPVTINIDYVREIEPLIDDGDEPLMPVEDRVVLLYGALHRAWSRERNPEEANRNYQLFQAKLARMAGKIEEGFDKPVLKMDYRYLANKRGPRLRGARIHGLGATGGNSSYTMPTYLQDVIINGATLTGNMLVNSGITIDGRDISADGAALDAHVAASTNVHGIGVTSSVVGTATTQVLTGKTLDTSLNHILGSLGKVAAYDATTGDLESTTVNATELGFLSGTQQEATVALNDNQASAATIFELTSSYNSIVVFYGIKRGTSIVESGLISLTNNGTTASIAPFGTTVGSSGVTLSSDVSGGNVRVRYTSTSTGDAPSFTYRLIKWIAV